MVKHSSKLQRLLLSVGFSWLLQLVYYTHARPMTASLVQSSSKAPNGIHGSFSRSDLQEKLSEAEADLDYFLKAESCGTLPTSATSTPDRTARLWGWRDGRSCAFKDGAGHVLFYPGYVPASWLHTPPCKSAPFPENSVADSRFKVWGWEDGELCAFKDDRQQPTPIDKQLYKLQWVDAPACTEDPEPSVNNSMPDRHGCLWGWQLDRNCAYKANLQPVYYQGYNSTCNITDQIQPGDNFMGASPSDAFAAAEAPTYPGGPLSGVNQAMNAMGNEVPGAVTSVGLLRQRAREVVDEDSYDNSYNSTKDITTQQEVLNTAITMSSDDTSQLDEGGLVFDTPVPVSFDKQINLNRTEPGGNVPAITSNTNTVNTQPQDSTSDDNSKPYTRTGGVLGQVEARAQPVGTTASEDAAADSKPASTGDSSTVSPHPTRRLQASNLDGKKTQITGTEVASEEDQRPPEWYTRGPGDLAPPIHLSRGTASPIQSIPESKQPGSMRAAEYGTVLHKPVPQSLIPEPTWDHGPGGISLPHPRSTRGRRIRLAASKPTGFTVAEGGPLYQGAAETSAGPSHALDSDDQVSKRLLPILKKSASTNSTAAPNVPLSSTGTSTKARS